MMFYAELFLIGVLTGLGSCFLKCAPLILPFLGLTVKSTRSGVIAILLFQLTRFCFYIPLVFIIYKLGAYKFHYIEISYYLRLAGGIFIVIVSSLYLIGNKIFSQKCYRHFKEKLLKENRKIYIFLGAFSSSFHCPILWFLIPYIISITTNFQHALLAMVFFGFGTFFSPLLPSAFLLGKLTSQIEFQKIDIFQKICALILFAFGIYSIAKI